LPAAFVDELTRALRRQRAFRVDQLARLDAAGDPPSDPVRREVDATLRSSARLVLTEIDAALRRIQLGRFGRCERCGDAMSVEQLKALPMSTWCGSCQQLRELTIVKRLPGPSDRRPAP
jgi:RNA polymerase-binding transcription factor DksA